MSEANEPSISVREHIRWIPDQAREPTSTLVLTSSRRFFIDVRILKPKNPGEPDLPNEGGPMSRLEWAFAGTSSTTLIPGRNPSDKPIPHSKWNHWIDSNHDGPVSDEGDMYPDPDGIHVLEKGAMVNPATSRVTDYEELWVDEVAATITGEDGRKCAVLTLEDEKNGAQGMVIRIGQYVQGMLKVNGHVTIERWSWTEVGAWKRIVKLGDMFLPCSFAMGELEEGKEIVFGEYRWVVKEECSWY